jgi:hypothetical protein
VFLILKRTDAHNPFLTYLCFMIGGSSHCSVEQFTRNKCSLCIKASSICVQSLRTIREKCPMRKSSLHCFLKEAAEEGGGGERGGWIPLTTGHLLMQAADLHFMILIMQS